jgi:hypothetical protein
VAAGRVRNQGEKWQVETQEGIPYK